MSSISTATALSPSSPTVASAAYSGPTLPNAQKSEDGTKRKVAGWKHFVAGGVGGMTGAIVTSPFDVVKTRLQSDLFRTKPPPSSSSLPSSIAGSSSTVAPKLKPRPQGVTGLVYHFVETGHIIRNIYVNEGPKALFKGLGPTLVGVVPARAINFSTYAQMKSILASQLPSSVTGSHLLGSGSGGTGTGATTSTTSTSTTGKVEAAESSPIVHLGAAAVAGIVTSTATNPIWVVKTRLQLEARHKENNLPKPSAPLAGSVPRAPAPALGGTTNTVASKFLPAIKMTRDILQKEGVKGMYKGMSASYLGVSEGVIQWVLYERLKKISTQTYPGQPARSKAAEWVGIVGSSGGAKMVASLITYPHEVIRTRLRQAPNPGQAPRYTGLLQTLRLVIKEEGAASLYGGLSAHLMRVVPNAACMFTIYEIALRL